VIIGNIAEVVFGVKRIGKEDCLNGPARGLEKTI
jgi:hypothetical protein